MEIEEKFKKIIKFISEKKDSEFQDMLKTSKNKNAFFEKDAADRNVVMMLAMYGETKKTCMIIDKYPELLKEKDIEGYNIAMAALSLGEIKTAETLLEKYPSLLEGKDNHNYNGSDGCTGI